MQNLRPLNTNLTSINTRIGSSFQFIGTGVVSGGTTFTIYEPSVLPLAESYLIIFIRELNGSENVYHPYAFLVYMRNHEWSASKIGDVNIPNGGATVEIDDSHFIFTWTSTVWARAWIYKI